MWSTVIADETRMGKNLKYLVYLTSGVTFVPTYFLLGLFTFFLMLSGRQHWQFCESSIRVWETRIWEISLQIEGKSTVGDKLRAILTSEIILCSWKSLCLRMSSAFLTCFPFNKTMIRSRIRKWEIQTAIIVPKKINTFPFPNHAN